MSAFPSDLSVPTGRPSCRIRDLLERELPDHNFSQAFYTDPEIFIFEQPLLGRQWFLAAHCSELPGPGSFIERSVLGESFVLTCTAGGDYRAFYNVCRHRGSRMLARDEQARGALRCPYHSWTYDPDGQLIAAPSVTGAPGCLDVRLIEAGLFVLEGLIFIALDGSGATSTEHVTGACADLWSYHGLAEARVAARVELPTEANWKLVVENFLECYHCRPNHPQLISVYDHVLVSASTRPEDARAYMQPLRAWSERVRNAGTPVAPLKRIDPQQDQYSLSYRFGIKTGFDTLSEDGSPLAPLMGRFPTYDGGETFGFVGPFLHFSLANDHAVLIRVVPEAPERTSIQLTWLVDGKARPGVDYEIDRIRWLWETTVLQDRALVEGAQAGLRSRAYRPGRYAPLEEDLSGFKRWYLRLAGELAEI